MTRLVKGGARLVLQVHVWEQKVIAELVVPPVAQVTQKFMEHVVK